MKSCLLIVNTFKKEARALATSIGSFLKEQQVSVSEYAYDGTADYVAEGKVKTLASHSDFVVTLGGDGTVLFASRECAELGIPVFPVNLGEFGFLAGVSQNAWKDELLRFLDGKSPVSERSLVACEVLRGGKTVFKTTALNDVVISSIAASRLVNMEVAFNHALLGPFKANGIIVSTATGSTAYSAAAGGPIIDPSLDALLLTPISSFSLSARPLLFSPQGELAITMLPSRIQTGLSTDGQIDFALEAEDVIILRTAEKKAQLVASSQVQFYAALRSKLNWAGGPRA